ncbi:DUF4249 domain-containing protein [Fulvivirgaceae bacterium BMA10]|uniref:DUF4249 domain-containing protein n=1 Tax=Splendidivirga corallicola TaxID=3051826 RepID=A0ABT8KSU0_9BACT|nr:DUF4249 domain-containing protein [Fulvivirgaceae bacterium BMA10]
MRIKLKMYTTIIALFCSLMACEELIDLKHGESETRLVVDGTITNGPGPYYVFLQQTKSFKTNDEPSPVTDAVVTIVDDLDNQEVLEHIGKGVYEIDDIQGAIGRTYSLNIEYNGKTYASEATLLPVSEIDETEVNFRKETTELDEGYYVTIGMPLTSPGEISYYRWLVTENDSLYSGVDNFIITSDEFLADHISFELEYAFELDDKVAIEMHSLSEEAYNYYMALSELAESDGGLFSPSPVNPISNITNGALGLFRASAVSKVEVVIEN